MSPEEPATSSANPVPSWKELTDFIKTQARDDRELIDKWFKLAISLLTLIVVVAAAAIGIFGWKSLQEIQSTAERAAREAATEQVKKIMQEPQIQKLAQDTAAQLFKEGAYQKAIQQAVHGQMQMAIETSLIGDYTIAMNGVQNQSMRIQKKLPDVRKK